MKLKLAKKILKLLLTKKGKKYYGYSKYKDFGNTEEVEFRDCYYFPIIAGYILCYICKKQTISFEIDIRRDRNKLVELTYNFRHFKSIYDEWK